MSDFRSSDSLKSSKDALVDSRIVARARAFCSTCDGIGIVGDDNPLTYPTLCPMCDGGGLTERQADQRLVESMRAENLRRTERTRHDEIDKDRVIAAIFAGAMILLACGIGCWGLWYSGALQRVLGL